MSTGRLAVATSSAIGAVASKVVQALLLFGAIGFGVAEAGIPSLIARAQSVELRLLADNNDAALRTALAQAPARATQAPVGPQSEVDTPPKPTCETDEAACPSDEQTTAYLRAAFRSNAAHALQQYLSSRAGERMAAVRAASFELGAVDIRRQILSAAARPAAPGADPGWAAEVFDLPEARPQTSARTSGGLHPEQVLDDAIARRIEVLRSKPSVWRSLKVAAATPAPADVAAEGFLRAVLGDSSQDVQGLRRFFERTTHAYATQIAAAAEPHVIPPRTASASPDADLTARDRRVLSSFTAEAPDAVEGRLAAYRDGTLDPGSLVRRPLAAATSGTGLPPDGYSDIFPPSAPEAGGGGGGGGGGGIGAPDGREARSSGTKAASRSASGGPRFASRSFTRIRFVYC